MRFALYGKDPGASVWIVLASLLVFFALACWGYDPQKGFGALTKRGG
jgi:ABC-2 type transport system permease protein